jgi:endonuclease/exonuclease/phosphatase family metal-dependent hydrolase
VVASRFALQGCTAAPIAPGGDSRQFLRCKVDVRGSALDLVTVHFQSPRDGLNAARREGLDGADDWTGNYVLRLAQSRGLARDLAGSRGPLVVAGDLNAPESSPVIQALLGIGLRDAFSIAGRGYGFTHGHSLRLRHDILRIDHILVSPEVEVLYSFVGQSDATDHRPLIADLRW